MRKIQESNRVQQINEKFAEYNKKHIAQDIMLDDLKSRSNNITKRAFTLAGPNIEHVLKMYSFVVSVENKYSIYKKQLEFGSQNLVPMFANLEDISLTDTIKRYNLGMIDLDTMYSLNNKRVSWFKEIKLPDNIGISITTLNRGIRNSDSEYRMEEVMKSVNVKNMKYVRYGNFALIAWGITGE